MISLNKDLDALRIVFAKRSARVGLFRPLMYGDDFSDLDLFCDPSDCYNIGISLFEWSREAGYVLTQVVQHGPMAWAFIFAKLEGSELITVSVDIHFGIHLAWNRLISYSDLDGSAIFVGNNDEWPCLSDQFSLACYFAKQLSKRSISSSAIDFLDSQASTCIHSDTNCLLIRKVIGARMNHNWSRRCGKFGMIALSQLCESLKGKGRFRKCGRFVFRDFILYIKYAVNRIVNPVGTMLCVSPINFRSAIAVSAKMSSLFPGGAVIRSRKFLPNCLLDLFKRRIVLVRSRSGQELFNDNGAHIISRLSIRAKSRLPYWMPRS